MLSQVEEVFDLEDFIAQAPLPLSVALSACFGFTFIFVGGFYLFKERPELTNDHPDIIRRRILSVFITCLLSPAIVYFLLNSYNVFSTQLMLLLLGLRVEGLLNALFVPLLLVMILFLGPLVLLYFDEELIFQTGLTPFLDDITSLVGIRNYLVAPIAEEFVFRACVIAVLATAGCSTPILIFVSPLFFGAAHLHHIRDVYKKSQLYGKKDNDLRNAIIKTAFQFLYTTVFGWLSSFIFLRTGHIIAPIICHSFCNFMGFPAFERIGEHPRWKRVIWGSFLLGIGLFFYLLFPMTDPTMYSSQYYL